VEHEHDGAVVAVPIEERCRRSSQVADGAESGQRSGRHFAKGDDQVGLALVDVRVEEVRTAFDFLYAWFEVIGRSALASVRQVYSELVHRGFVHEGPEHFASGSGEGLACYGFDLAWGLTYEEDAVLWVLGEVGLDVFVLLEGAGFADLFVRFHFSFPLYKKKTGCNSK